MLPLLTAVRLRGSPSEPRALHLRQALSPPPPLSLQFHHVPLYLEWAPGGVFSGSAPQKKGAQDAPREPAGKDTAEPEAGEGRVWVGVSGDSRGGLGVRPHCVFIRLEVLYSSWRPGVPGFWVSPAGEMFLKQQRETDRCSRRQAAG